MLSHHLLQHNILKIRTFYRYFLVYNKTSRPAHGEAPVSNSNLCSMSSLQAIHGLEQYLKNRPIGDKGLSYTPDFCPLNYQLSYAEWANATNGSERYLSTKGHMKPCGMYGTPGKPAYHEHAACRLHSDQIATFEDCKRLLVA